MVEEVKLTADEIVEQADAYVLMASNGESIIGRSVAKGTSPLSLLLLARSLHEEADKLEAKVF